MPALATKKTPAFAGVFVCGSRRRRKRRGAVDASA